MAKLQEQYIKQRTAVSVFREDKWVNCRLAEVKEGETFMLFEDNNRLGAKAVALKDGRFDEETGTSSIEADLYFERSGHGHTPIKLSETAEKK